jgi:hypothetical protein
VFIRISRLPRILYRLVLPVCITFLLIACGGGGGSSPSTPSTPTANCGTILAANISNQNPDPATAGFALLDIIIDEDTVYWFEYDATQGQTGGSLKSFPKSGGAVTILASSLGGVNAIATDGTDLYWTEFDIGSGDGSVNKVPKGGGAVTILASGFPLAEGGGTSLFDVYFPKGIALDASYVYWGEQVGLGAIRRVPKMGGPVLDLGRGQGFGPNSIVMDAGFIYGVDGSKASRLPIAGGTVQVLASGLVNPFSAVLDAGSLYWVELTSPSGKVAKIPKAGGTVTTLVSNLDNPKNVALDDTFAYFTTSPDGLQKVLKSGGTPANGGNCSPDGSGPAFKVVVDTLEIYWTMGDATGVGNVVKASK